MKAGLQSSFLISCIICIISNVLCGLAAFVPTQYGFGLMLSGRIGLGIASGIGTVISPVYFNDISPIHLKGIIGASYQLATVGGILVSQLLAVQMATKELYGWLLFSPTLVSLIQLILAPFLLPESPSWLRSKGMTDEAFKVSKRLGLLDVSDNSPSKNSSNIEDQTELSTDSSSQTHIRSSPNLGPRSSPSSSPSLGPMLDDLTSNKSLTLIQIISDPKLSVSLFMLLALQIGQQLCGIGALFFYSTDFFILAGLENPTFGTLLASGVNVVAVICVLPLLMNKPRRKLLIIGLSGMFISALILTSALLSIGDGADKMSGMEQEGISPPILSVLEERIEEEGNEVVGDDVVSVFISAYIPYIALTVVLTFIIFYELSIGLVPWIVGAELFPANSKDAAFSFASGTLSTSYKYICLGLLYTPPLVRVP